MQFQNRFQNDYMLITHTGKMHPLANPIFQNFDTHPYKGMFYAKQ